MADDKKPESTDDLLKRARKAAGQGNPPPVPPASGDKKPDGKDGGIINDAADVVSDAASALKDGAVKAVATGYVKTAKPVSGFFKFYKPLWEKIKKPFVKVYDLYKWLHKKTDMKHYEKAYAKTDASAYEKKSAKMAARVGRGLLWGSTKLGRGLLYLFTATTLTNTASFLVPDSVPVAGPVLDKSADVLNYVSYEPVWDGVRMAGYGWNASEWGVRQDTVYFTGYTEASADKGHYTLTATSMADRQKIVGVDEGLFFDLKPSLVHHVWSLFEKGHLHNPSLIIAPVPKGGDATHAYLITHYGHAWRLPVLNDVRGKDDILDIQRLPDDFNKAAPKPTSMNQPANDQSQVSREGMSGSFNQEAPRAKEKVEVKAPVVNKALAYTAKKASI